MDDSEFMLKKVCCTCLSRDRKLSQLCRLKEGINNLYLLLSYDSEAYREGFHKDTASWYICWECWAIMTKISMFRSQACSAQRLLSNIADGQLRHPNACLSRLTLTHKSSIDMRIEYTDPIDNFIDCGPDIKTESDDDKPLSLLHKSLIDDRTYSDEDNTETLSKTNNKFDNSPKVNPINSCQSRLKKKSTDSLKRKKKMKDTNKVHLSDRNKKYFREIRLNEEEMLDSRAKRKMAAVFADAPFKCESCIEAYKSKTDLDRHIVDVHVINVLKKKLKYIQCDICLVYIKRTIIDEHRYNHYLKFACQFCDYITYSLSDVLKHLKSGHAMQNLDLPSERRKGTRRTPKVAKPGSKPRRNRAMMDKRTPFGYLCAECDKYFDNKNQRWKHIQRHHREGYKCTTCGKRFAFKNNLSRHEQMHQGPPPREECQVCHKMVRVDLLKIHANIHTQRDRYRCAECDKCFVSRASYEHHLKYTQAHAAIDILKYKCSMCDKGYRSRGELRDHVNYQHMDKTQHKCPICDKALATRRCITRHVRRAHDGVKENAKDKICQQCGKTFRDKKCLREHEFIHTGERPLSCEICGCTFRQSASLYTHKKRVHKIFPSKKTVTLVESQENS